MERGTLCPLFHYLSGMETFEFVLVALLLLIGQFFIALLTTYFTKKGEYMAIKEEIAHITRTTEGIKKELDLIAENEISFRAERRQTIIKYFETIDQVQTYVTHQIPLLSPTDEVTSGYLTEIYPQFSVLTSKLDLFVDSKEVGRLSSEINDLLHKIVRSAHDSSLVISEIRADDPTRSSQIDFIIKKHYNYIGDIQKQLLPKRTELMIKFREILKQDYERLDTR